MDMRESKISPYDRSLCELCKANRWLETMLLIIVFIVVLQLGFSESFSHLSHHHVPANIRNMTAVLIDAASLSTAMYDSMTQGGGATLNSRRDRLCGLRVKAEHTIILTERENKTRNALLSSVRKLLLPAVQKLGSRGMYAVVVDCVGEFVKMCKNLATSARKVGLHGIVVLTTTPAMCKGLESILGEYGFCIDQTEPFKLAQHHVASSENCKSPRHNTTWRVSSGYYTRNHGNLVELMLTRSFFWFELTNSGVGLVSADADIAFLQNPLSKGILDPSRFSLELSFTGVKSHLNAGKCNLKKGIPLRLDDEAGVHVMCGASPPPYFATPASSWWFERHTMLGVMCQADIQTDTTVDLETFYQRFRRVTGPASLQGQLFMGKHEPLVRYGDWEFQGQLNMSMFEPPTSDCNGVGTGVRFLPMDVILEKCVHPHPFNSSKEASDALVAFHANCATGKGANVVIRRTAKVEWLKNSGMWFLPD